MNRIPPLRPGATLALIAPAGPPRAEQIARVPALIEAHGFRHKLMPHAAGPAFLRHLAATDDERLADLHTAFADPEVDAVVSLRGGYGCTRLLDRIDTDLLRAHPKLLVGFSDITALHALRDGLGQPGLHAPMPASNLLDAPDEAERLFSLLRTGLVAGQDLAPVPAPHPLNLAVGAPVVGRLIGGNLAVLAALAGTPWFPARTEGAILFLEDVAEEPYRIDRLLCQLRHTGLLGAVAGFVLGSFTDANEAPDAVLMDYLHGLRKPVLAGWPAGHSVPNYALPMGLDVELDAKARTLRVV